MLSSVSLVLGRFRPASAGSLPSSPVRFLPLAGALLLVARLAWTRLSGPPARPLGCFPCLVQGAETSPPGLLPVCGKLPVLVLVPGGCLFPVVRARMPLLRLLAPPCASVVLVLGRGLPLRLRLAWVCPLLCLGFRTLPSRRPGVPGPVRRPPVRGLRASGCLPAFISSLFSRDLSGALSPRYPFRIFVLSLRSRCVFLFRSCCFFLAFLFHAWYSKV